MTRASASRSPKPTRRLRNRTRQNPPKKYCHCTPACNKKLTQQTRRLHYRLVAKHGGQKDAASSIASSDVNLNPPSRAHRNISPSSPRNCATLPSLSPEINFYPTDDHVSVEVNLLLDDIDKEVAYRACTLNMVDIDLDLFEDMAGLMDLDDTWSGIKSDIQPLDDEDMYDEGQDIYESRNESLSNPDSYHGSSFLITGDSGPNSNLEPEPTSDGYADTDGSESEFDNWDAFDENEELDAILSDEEKLRELEDMFSAEEYAEYWQDRSITEEDEDNI